MADKASIIALINAGIAETLLLPGTTPPPPPTGIAVGDTIEVTSASGVRTVPGTGQPQQTGGNEPIGSRCTVTAITPQAVDGELWYQGTWSATSRTGYIRASRVAKVTAGPAPPPVVTPPAPTGETITVNAATKFQMMQGWEAHARAWEEDKALNKFDQTWRTHCAAVANYLVNQIGLNRIQVPLRSGWINPTDYFAQFETGALSYTAWDVKRYEKIGNFYQWSEFDFKVETSVVPMAAALAARGEKLYVNLGVVDFGGPGSTAGVAKYVQGSLTLSNDPAAYANFVLACFNRLKSKYGITADALELCNEPENSSWNGTEIGNALVAVKAKLVAAGFANVNYIGPSPSSSANMQSMANAILSASSGGLNTLSYHRYDSPSTAAIIALAVYALGKNLKLNMSEWTNATVDTLLEDLTVGNVVSWQKWAVAIRGGNTPPFYVIADLATTPPTITPAPNTAMMTAVMKYVRMGAQRVAATNVGAARKVVAFVNTDGTHVVCIKATASGSVKVSGLTPGTYGSYVVSMAGTMANGASVIVAADGSATIPLGIGMTTLYGKGAAVPVPVPTPIPTPTPTPTPGGALLVALNFGAGSIAKFNQATAIDKGEFVGEFVRQKCFLSVDPAFPDWRVYFRPDSDGTREEVVVEYGRTKAGSLATMGYTATITRTSPLLYYTVTVPKHYGYGRWRWQSKERPVVRTPAALKARKWLPNFGAAGLYGKPAATSAATWGGPFSAPLGFDPFMGSTGGNAQIGHLTTYAAEYVLHGSPSSLIGMRTEAEWMGNWCIHMRDDVTGAPLDVRGQSLKTKNNGGTINDWPALPLAANPGFVTIDSAHRYSCPNLPWMLTDDPYLLEELQFGCNRHVLDGQYHRFLNGLQGMVYPGQTRSFAWGIRDLFVAALTTPASVPSWLLPRSYFQACVDDNKAYAMKFVNSMARVHSLFRTWTRSDLDAAWQTSYLNGAVGVGVSMGFVDWLPIFAWGVDKHIQQTNGTSGWPRQWPVPYYSIPDRGAVYGTPTGLMSAAFDTAVLPPGSTTPRVCSSWADYWSFYKSGSPDAQGVKHSDASGATVNDAGWDATTIQQRPTGPAYFLQLRAVLALAVTHGIAGATASYAYIDERLRNQLLPQYGNQFGLPQFSIDP